MSAVKEKIINCESINGKSLTLKISKFENAAIKIKVAKIQNNDLFKKKIQCLLLIVLNIAFILFKFNLLLIMGAIVSFLFIFTVIFETESESLLVIPSFGFQIKTKYRFGQSTVFVSWESFKDIIINEIISMHKVTDYLTIITKDENDKPNEKVILIFSSTRPRLAYLQIIYQEMQTVIQKLNL